MKQAEKIFSKDWLTIDPNQEVDKIVQWIRDTIHNQLHRRGAVLGISGGIDSSVVLALCVKALGPKNVVGLMLPETESSPDSADLASLLATQLGIETITENISDTLAGAGCYNRRDEAIRSFIPEFTPEWKSKITLPGSLLDDQTLNVFYLTAVAPQGTEIRKRIPPKAFAQIVAASNFKQRVRMSMLYYHAERLNYAVVGTANKNEHGLGFFVKHGDGGVDLQPILHLFKSQVYQLAEVLNIPDEICKRTPTSDTYSAGSSQEEFFFRLPFDILDLIWLGYEEKIPAQQVADALGLQEEQVERVMEDIQRKQRTTEYLRNPSFNLISINSQP
ncbi:MAG: NAD(+) synthase [Chloroflexi bacterium HGW-Chloroflexi-10]|nr:MAG: NAD(+) synthase [Chloroflexi bacterium HGW-Chloroflexi-10]